MFEEIELKIKQFFLLMQKIEEFEKTGEKKIKEIEKELKRLEEIFK